MLLGLEGESPDLVDPDAVGPRETGADMKVECKETARGGLAVNVVEC